MAMINGEIYYASLLPVDLNLLLNEKTQKTYSIKLKPFPIEDEKEIANVFISFITNKPKQMGIIGKTLPSLKRLEEQGASIENLSFSATGVGIDSSNLESYIVNHDFYLYAKIKGSDIDIPVEKVSGAIISREVEAPISVKDKVFFSSYLVTHKKNGTALKIGNSITFNVDENKRGEFIIKLKGNLSSRINDLEFLIAFTKEESVNINGASLFITPPGDCQIKEFEDISKFYKDVLAALKLIGVTEELNYDEVTEQDAINLRNFVNAVLYNKEIGFPEISYDSSFGFFNIANLKILLWYDRQESGFFKVENFFTKHELTYCENQNVKKAQRVSQYLVLPEIDFSHVSNLNCDLILSDLASYPAAPYSINAMNFIVLKIISGYDKQTTKQAELLKLAKDICKLLEKEPQLIPPEIVKLNYYQIIKRERKFTVDEIVELAALKNEKNDLAIRCGSYILLGEYDKANDCISDMSKEDADEFKKYPIYSMLERKDD